MNSSGPLTLGVLVSGGGRSLENLAEAIARGELCARIALVISNRADAFALQRAQRLGIESTLIPQQAFASAELHSAAVFAALEHAGVELAVLAGYLRKLVVPAPWLGRVINIHPALLPDFGGKGFFGERVHRAVLESGVPSTGCTVHYVTNEYDSGPILLQRRIEVRAEDEVHTLAERVFAEEKLALPEAIRLHASGKLRWQDGRVVQSD